MEANAGEYIKNDLHLKRFPRISLHCKLAPVQYWEYEYGLLDYKPEFLRAGSQQRGAVELIIACRKQGRVV